MNARVRLFRERGHNAAPDIGIEPQRCGVLLEFAREELCQPLFAPNRLAAGVAVRQMLFGIRPLVGG